MRRKVKRIARKIGSLLHGTAEKRHALVGPAELWEMKRAFQIDYLRRVGLLPRHTLLDIGCGTLRGGIPVIDYLEKGHYAGADVREEVIGEARKELAEAGLEGKEPTLVAVKDIGSLDLGRTFDYAWAFSVLLHMPDPVMEATMGCVARHLAPEGSFYANVHIGTRPDGTWQGFPNVARTVEFYGAACGRHGLSMEDVGGLAELGHVTGRRAQDSMRMMRIRRRAATAG
jgi:SAM-dependent methyltransferase